MRFVSSQLSPIQLLKSPEQERNQRICRHCHPRSEARGYFMVGPSETLRNPFALNMAPAHFEEQVYGPREYDHNKRLYNDLTTMFAEMIDGEMRTPFEYEFDGEEFFAEDGSALRQVFDNSLAAADDLIAAKPQLYFEARRRGHEREELSDMEAMARGELPNTMVVVSDFPAELMDWPEDVGGYNVERKQTMLRVITWRNGKITMYSQTLDGSDRQALEAIYEFFGTTAEPGELLGQRIHTDLPADAHPELLTEELTNVYDSSLSAGMGGTWRAGRLAEECSINTYNFVRAQHDLVQRSMALRRLGKFSNEEIYNTVAAISRRLEAFRSLGAFDDATELEVDTYGSPMRDIETELQFAGKQAREAGQLFSACGETLDSEEGTTAAEQLASAGYGNKVNSATEYKFDKKTFCVVCQNPPKTADKPKMCGPCSICRKCDAHLKITNKE